MPLGVPPDHRSLSRILQGIAPDKIIELGDSNPDQAIATVAVGKGISKDSIQ
jgi:hypothetical protein